MALIPDIVIHEVVSGGSFTGVPSDGTLEGAAASNTDPYYGGRVNFYSQGTDGGLYQVPAGIGGTVYQISFNGVGTTDWSLDLVSNSYPASAPVSFTSNIITYSALNMSGFFASAEQFVWQPSRPIFIPPNHYLKFSTTGALGADARVSFCMGGGWGYRTLQFFS